MCEPVGVYIHSLSNHPLLISFMIVAKRTQNALCPSCDVIQDIIYILCGLLSYALFIALYTECLSTGQARGAMEIQSQNCPLDLFFAWF